MSPTPWDLPPRIAAKIAVDAETDCWLWTASRSRGYGRVWCAGAPSTTAHRAVYELIAYEIPDGMELDHICGIHRCVNPRHVEPVTHGENVLRRSAATLSLPIFPCGHPRTNENTKVLPSRTRTPGLVCLECQRAKNRAWYYTDRARREQAAA